MDDFVAAENTPFYRANGFSLKQPRGDKSAHDIVIVEEEGQKLMIGISDTGVIQIKNLITGVETQFTGPVDEGLIPGGDYGAAYNFQNEVYASNNNGNGMIWIDWKNADYENKTIRTVNVFTKTQITNRNDGINCIQEKSPLDVPEDIDTDDSEDNNDEVPETEEVEEIAITDEAPETEEIEEIAITVEVLETEEELPVTGVNSVHMVLIALVLLVAGSLLLASSKIKAAEKVVA